MMNKSRPAVQSLQGRYQRSKASSSFAAHVFFTLQRCFYAMTLNVPAFMPVLRPRRIETNFVVTRLSARKNAPAKIFDVGSKQLNEVQTSITKKQAKPACYSNYSKTIRSARHREYLRIDTIQQCLKSTALRDA